MNERFDELLKASTDNILGVPVVDQKKFAELIVRECADIADKNSPLSFPDHGIKIKRHFGVKE